MSDHPFTASSAFSRVMLPKMLFPFPPDRDSMLLAGRFARPYVQNLWREFCKGFNLDPSPTVDALNTDTKWLKSKLASVIFHLPPPQRPGDAYLALFVIPARPEDGPRRYFTLEIPETPTASGPATALVEWLAASNGPAAFRPVHHAEGIEPNPEALGTAVEAIVFAPDGTVTAPEIGPAGGARQPGSGPTLFTRFVVMRGNALVSEAVGRGTLVESSLSNSAAMLLSLRLGAGSVVRANPRTGEVQEVTFGIPQDVFPLLPPDLWAVHRDWPGYLFSVSSEGQAQMLNLLVPEGAARDAFAVAASMLVRISGEPDPAGGVPAEQQRRTCQTILAQRPALVSILARVPADQDRLADLLGFTQHLAAALFLEDRPRPTAAPGLFSRWLGKFLGKRNPPPAGT